MQGKSKDPSWKYGNSKSPCIFLSDPWISSQSGLQGSGGGAEQDVQLHEDDCPRHGLEQQGVKGQERFLFMCNLIQSHLDVPCSEFFFSRQQRRLSSIWRRWTRSPRMTQRRRRAEITPSSMWDQPFINHVTKYFFVLRQVSYRCQQTTQLCWTLGQASTTRPATPLTTGASCRSF